MSTPRHIRDLSVGFALSALATAATVHAQPRVIYTDAAAPAGGNGAAWSTAFRDLQDAFAAANADPQRVSRGVEIRLAQGLYTPARGTLDRTQAFTPSSGVTLMGGFAGLSGGPNPDQRSPGQFVSVLSGDLANNDGPNFTNYGDNSYCIVNASNSGQTVLDGLTITSGNANPSTLAGPKGVVTAFALNPDGSSRFGKISLLNNCRLLGNRGTTASILNMNLGAVKGCEISGNWTQDQTVVDARSSFLTSCRVRGNRATGSPTGSAAIITVRSGTEPQPLARLAQCLIVDNVSDGWGAVRSVSNHTLQLFNCTIAGNAAAGAEAVWHAVGTLSLRNSVIARNVRTSTSPAESNLQIAVWNPLAFDIDVSVLIDNGGAGVRYLSSSAIPGPYLSGDPKFASPAGPDGNPDTWQDNDYHLSSGSLAVDRANATDPIFAPGFADLDGLPLFDDPATVNSGFGAITYGDLGCFEYHRVISADFDQSGTVNIVDVFAFLTAWFAGDARTDVDGNGISVSDVFAFLTAWFAAN